MPHERRRDAIDNVRRMLKYSPLVGILGHRQVGKTTLLSRLVKRYVTFDDAAERAAAAADAAAYLRRQASAGCVGLDECQFVPALFPALKEWVRSHPRPGQFLLSGSVRFTSRHAIRESLTGRLVTQELLPFTIGEMAQEPLAGGLLRVIGRSSLDQIGTQWVMPRALWQRRTRDIALFIERGGLPGICMMRNAVMRQTKIGAQLQTLLDRDLRLIVPTSLSYQTVYDVAAYVATHVGQPINWSDMQRAVHVTPPTLKKLLYALEAIFIVRTVPIEGSSSGQVYYFEDVAEWQSLCGGHVPQPWLLAQLIFHHARVQWIYQLERTAAFFQYRTRGGALVPVCIRSPEGVVGLLPIAAAEPNRSEVAIAASFLKTYAQGKLLYLTEATAVPRGSSRTAILPLAAITF
ncbi:MAG: ATP-binding protein [Deltaproteobacteria bacterium]|nr:ATP-binding protein [Deltaproteobacteria bacterium]